MSLKNGDKVTVEYEGTFDNGEVFDSSKKHGQPLQFEIGSKQVIPGFENAIKEMKKGEEKTIKLEPKDAYGDHNPTLVQKIPREQIPAEAKVGSMLGATLPTGQQVPVQISEMDEKEATIDLNHPMAGKTLNFKLTLVEIN
ncbi:peptidylprolyl isomerase [Candidatus Woesearchaeota archaeon]|nr:peptidylprolyl isomerase [Candidatus Woesearchaeota archaeon]